jgi:hypothetical protein
VGAIGVVGPAERLRSSDALVTALRDTAMRLSWEMGARRGRRGGVPRTTASAARG